MEYVLLCPREDGSAVELILHDRLYDDACPGTPVDLAYEGGRLVKITVPNVTLRGFWGSGEGA